MSSVEYRVKIYWGWAWASPTLASQTVDFSYIGSCEVATYRTRKVAEILWFSKVGDGWVADGVFTMCSDFLTHLPFVYMHDKPGSVSRI